MLPDAVEALAVELADAVICTLFVEGSDEGLFLLVVAIGCPRRDQKK